MKKTSIGTWAYNVGPYGENPIPFDTVGSTLAKLNFQGMESVSYTHLTLPTILLV